MNHDPLCMWSTSATPDPLPGYDCGECDLIAKVREDQTQRCIAALEADDLHETDPDWASTSWNNAVFECREILRALLSNDSVPDPASEEKP